MTGLPLPAARLRAAVTVAPPRLRLAFLVVVAVLVAVTAVRYYGKADTPSRTGDLTRTAFLRWRPQILALDAGTDIYRAYNYPNPPVMALLLRPLAGLPPLAGAMLWFALKTAMGVAIVAWAFRLIGAPMPDWAKALAVAFGLHPMLGDLAHGNVNLFVGFLTVGALELYRRRWDAAAGLTLALAVACKVTPALFLPYFAWKRGWRVLAGAAAGLGLWLFVVPAAALGWDENVTLLGSWFDGMVRPFVIDGKVTSEHPNQSLPGLAFRLLTREPSFIDYDADERPVAADFHTLVDLGPAAARRLVQGAMLAFAAAVVLTCRWPGWRPGVPRGGSAFAAECGLVLLGMLLFSERTWKHHAVAAVVPVAVLAWAVASDRLPRAVRWWVGGTFAAVLLLTAGPSGASAEVQDAAMVYGAYTAAWTLEAVALVVVLVALRRTAPAPC
jgi:hypothetical protein